MEIGKHIGKQRSIFPDPKVINGLSNAVNVLRKPHFDETYFRTEQDITGWYVSLNRQAILAGLPFFVPPFLILPDESKPGDTEKRYIKIKKGRWTRSNGLDRDLVDLEIETPEDPFSSRYNNTGEVEDDWLQMSIDTDDTQWIWLELHGSSGLNGLNPTEIKIKSGSARPKLEDYPVSQNDGIGHNAIVVIGRVRNYGGTILIYQEHVGNINDRGCYVDSVSYDDGGTVDGETLVPSDTAHIYGLNYVSTDSNDRAKNAIQDYDADKELLDKEEVLNNENEVCGVFYKLNKSSTEAKQIEKRYYRIDAQDAYTRGNSGKSLNIIDEPKDGEEAAKRYMEIFDFYGCDGSDGGSDRTIKVTDASKMTNNSGGNLVLSRNNDSGNGNVVPTVRYLDLKSLLEKPTMKVTGSAEVDVTSEDIGIGGITVTHNDSTDHYGTADTSITVNSDYEGYYQVIANCIVRARIKYSEPVGEETPKPLPYDTEVSFKIKTASTTLCESVGTFFVNVEDNGPSNVIITSKLLSGTLNCHGIMIFDSANETGKSNSTDGTLIFTVNNNTLDYLTATINVIIEKVKPIPVD